MHTHAHTRTYTHGLCTTPSPSHTTSTTMATPSPAVKSIMFQCDVDVNVATQMLHVHGTPERAINHHWGGAESLSPAPANNQTPQTCGDDSPAGSGNMQPPPWLNYRDDLVCEELGITWQSLEQFTSGNGTLCLAFSFLRCFFVMPLHMDCGASLESRIGARESCTPPFRLPGPLGPVRIRGAVFLVAAHSRVLCTGWTFELQLGSVVKVCSHNSLLNSSMV